MPGPEDRPAAPTDPAVTPDVEAVQASWDRVIADMEATAGDYRDRGWSTLELHPGDVAAVGPDRTDRWGFDLLLPDDEFHRLESWLDPEEPGFDSCEVLAAAAGGIEFRVVAMLDDVNQRAVLFPVYYDPQRAAALLEAAEAAGVVRAHLRPLVGESLISFTIEEPELLFPERTDR